MGRLLTFLYITFAMIATPALAEQPQPSAAVPTEAMKAMSSKVEPSGPVQAEAAITPHPKGETPSAAQPFTVTLRLGARATGALHTEFQVDPGGTQAPSEPSLSTRLRLRAGVDSGSSLDPVQLRLRLGAEAMSGTWYGAPKLEGDDLPQSERRVLEPTEAFAELKVGPWFGLRGGLMLSQWGLGLIANSGDHMLSGRYGHRPFELHRLGDRLLRTLIFSRPFANAKHGARGLVVAGAFDRVYEDDTSRWRAGDETYQGVASVRMMLSARDWFGVYYVYRDQRGEGDDWLRAHIIDVAGDGAVVVAPGHQIRLQAELVAILGETSYAPSPEHPVHDIVQLAGLMRASWSGNRVPLSAELDLGFFSGDGNQDDGRLTRFVSDKNFQQGLVLFPTVLAWQTGRQRLTATVPEVLGYPPEDLDRLATDGGVTSAVTVYPKLTVRPVKSFALYTGVLMAWTPTDIPDPYLSRTLGGGAAYNALGAPPKSRFLGMEFDLGVRLDVGAPVAGLRAQLVGEYGAFLPGGALADANGNASVVHAGRVSLILSAALNNQTEEGK